MRNLFVISLLFLVGFGSKGQNLVPNPSFETYSSCPLMGILNKAVPWVAAGQSPDFFHSCWTGGPIMFDVPSNIFGYQAARTGDGYIGIIVYYNVGSPIREYPQIKLLDSLKQDYIYCVEFYVSLADSAWYATTEIGVHFSSTVIGGPANLLPLYETPQICSPPSSFITDDTGWTLISGLYTAHGGEEYITIGKFGNDVNIDTVSTGVTAYSSPGMLSAYYYIDDISVVLCDSIVGISTVKMNYFTLYPNPTNGKFEVRSSEFGVETIEIYDLFGRLVLRTNKPEIDMSSYPAGLYIWQAGEARGKLVKE